MTDLDYYGGWLILAACHDDGDPSAMHTLWRTLFAEAERRRFEAEIAELAQWALDEMKRAIYATHEVSPRPWSALP